MHGGWGHDEPRICEHPSFDQTNDDIEEGGEVLKGGDSIHRVEDKTHRIPNERRIGDVEVSAHGKGRRAGGGAVGNQEVEVLEDSVPVGEKGGEEMVCSKEGKERNFYCPLEKQGIAVGKIAHRNTFE